MPLPIYTPGRQFFLRVGIKIPGRQFFSRVGYFKKSSSKLVIFNEIFLFLVIFKKTRPGPGGNMYIILVEEILGIVNNERKTN